MDKAEYKASMIGYRTSMSLALQMLAEGIKDLNSTKFDRGTKANAINAFINRLKKQTLPLDYFDDRLWLEVIDHVTVHVSGDLVFIFQNGLEITVEKHRNDR